MAFYRGQQGTVFFDKDASGGKSEIAAVRSWTTSVEKDSLPCDIHGDASLGEHLVIHHRLFPS